MTKLGLLYREFDRVSVKRHVKRDAEFHAAGSAVRALGKVVAVGGLQGAVLGVFQDFLEINVHRFVIGCVGIGNVALKQFHALAANTQCFLVNAVGVIDHVHANDSIALKFFAVMPTSI